MSEHIRIEDRDGVRLITIARPQKKNALTHAMYTALADAIAGANNQPHVRVVVLTGEGEMFTAGNDLNDFLTSPPQGDASNLPPVFRFLHALLDADKPLVVAVNGPAIGIGLTLCLHADLVYMADSASFRAAFVDLALVPEAASSLLLPERIGRARAGEIFFLGETVDAARALELGLVTGVFPRERLFDEVLGRARAIALKAPAAVRETKRLVVGDRERIRARMAEEAVIFSRQLGSEEFREAAAAVFEKRVADFSRFG